MPHAGWSWRLEGEEVSAAAERAGVGEPVSAGQAGPGSTASGAAPEATAGPAESNLTWQASFPLDVRLVLSVHRRGPQDPTFRTDASRAIWRTSLTPRGPVTLRVAWDQPAPAAPIVTATAWGPGASWALGRLPDLLGAGDDPAAFRPEDPRLRKLAARFAGLRLGRTDRVLEALVPAVLEQKVPGLEAVRAWRRLLTWYGTPAPGPAPAGLRVFPAPEVWCAIPAWDWHRAGVEGVRAATIMSAAKVSGRLEEIGRMAAADADRRLRSLPGIGPWTSAEIRQRACGDPDAVSVGDYHLPGQVGWTLTGQAADDAGMLALLAPYPGQRHRAARLIELGGSGPPRRGPRLEARDFRAI
jgi:3-methyladenine DNA glycosylase/8-oxoguanine DNA glycosylase